MSSARYHAVLTGAGGGLGRAIAQSLGSVCASLLLVSTDFLKLQALQRELQTAHPQLVTLIVAGDLTDPSVRQRVLEAAKSLPAPADLLINNAGVNDFYDFATQSSAAIERLMAVNLQVPIQLTQMLLPLLKAAPCAQIINIGSILGYIGYPGFVTYCATKFGLRGFSQALRRELADTTVSVRYFAPRSTRTPLNSDAMTAMNRDLGTYSDSPEAVAHALLRFIGTRSWDRKLGFPERLYVFVNQLVPAITDRSLWRQLPIIRKHLPASAPPTATHQGVKS